MNEKEMLMRQLRANAFPHNNGKVMQAINIIRHGYNRLTDVQQAAQIWGVSQNAVSYTHLDVYKRQKDGWCCIAHGPALYEMQDSSIELQWNYSTDGHWDE